MKTYWYSGRLPFEGAEWQSFTVNHRHCIISYYTPDRESTSTDLWVKFSNEAEALNMLSYLSTFIGLPYHQGMRNRIRKMYEAHNG